MTICGSADILLLAIAAFGIWLACSPTKDDK